MIPSLKQFVVAMVVLVLIDAVWLLTAGRLALTMTEAIQGSPVVFRVGGALVVYVALAYLIYQPNTVLEAGLMGSAVYAVYDFTSYAILKKYDLKIAIADTVWGGVLFAATKAALKYLKVE
jgi:uncharacterized membrane protein